MIKTSRSLADRLQRSVQDDSNEIVRLVKSAGGKIDAPTGTVGDSAQYFAIDNLSLDNAERLREKLAKVPGIEAAYLKPADELP